MDKSVVESLVHEAVTEFSVKSACAEGDGMAGKLLSVSATTKSGKIIQFIYKQLGEGKDDFANAFVTENMVYNKVIPMMTEFGLSRGLVPTEKEDSIIPAPKVIDHCRETEAKEIYICLEDLRPHGYNMANKYESLTEAQVKLILSGLARFHAIGYSLIRYEGEKLFDLEGPLHQLVSLDEATNGNGPEGQTKIIDGFMESFAGALRLALNSIEAHRPDLLTRVKGLIERTGGYKLDPKIQWPIMCMTDTQLFPVIVHGDLWTNNVMFKYDEKVKDHPISVRFIDFQFTRRGNIFEDLGYFFYTSTTPAFRAVSLIPVLKEYHETFVKTLDILKTPVPIGWTLGKFLDIFKETIPANYRYMCFAIPLQLGTSMEAIGRMMQKDVGEESEVSKISQGIEEVTENGHADHGTKDEGFRGAESFINEFQKIMKLQLETEPRAIERLMILTQELADLQIL